jgi:hypothetical protein
LINTVFFGKLRIWPRVASSRTTGSAMAAMLCWTVSTESSTDRALAAPGWVPIADGVDDYPFHADVDNRLSGNRDYSHPGAQGGLRNTSWR